MRKTLIPFAVILVFACGEPHEGADPAATSPLPPDAQAISLLGDTLYAPELPAEVWTDRQAQLAAARADHEADPSSADALIWYGRRTAYLGDYRAAIAIYSEGIVTHPNDPRLYRHRGHRYISVRQFDAAVADLERAALLIAGRDDEIEPDGMPNARNIPTSTLHSNIWYHLGLAYYLKGDLENALRAYRECLKVSTNPDMLVATSHWLYMTLRRLGRDAEATRVLEPIHADLDIIENASYHRLLLMYKGELAAEALLDEAQAAGGLENATLGYGIGNWHAYNGRPKQAEAVFRTILKGHQWTAFGYIAAEADLQRSRA